MKVRVQVYGPGNNPNKDLSWEKQISYNLGIDYTLFNSRLSGSLDLFIREGKDVIGEYQVPVPPYLHEKIMTNVGTTNSKGFELQVNWDAVQNDKFTYSTNATLAYTKSKLKSFSNEKYELGYMEGDGLPSPGNPGPCQRLQVASRSVHSTDTVMQVSMKTEISWFTKVVKKEQKPYADATPAKRTEPISATVLQNGKWPGATPSPTKASTCRSISADASITRYSTKYQMYYGLQGSNRNQQADIRL